ncbi:hypothetical protein ABGT15_04570 [Flavobacterium enshiense]|uniref:hypothetical protein n=1 Tax=Flavobacterium enshiense TaxID=1341165 RepID=UPI00345CDAC8
MSCISKVTGNLSYDCSVPYKGGLETKAVLINRDDLDFTSVTTSGATVTNISLKAGKTGYSVQWLKDLGTTASEASINDGGLNNFKHSFFGRIFGSEASDVERASELLRGEFICVVETKFKGTNNSAAFKVYGLESSLVMSEGNYASNENDGSFLFTLATPENYGEPYVHNIWLETSYSTTKTKFDNLLSA